MCIVQGSVNPIQNLVEGPQKHLSLCIQKVKGPKKHLSLHTPASPSAVGVGGIPPTNEFRKYIFDTLPIVFKYFHTFDMNVHTYRLCGNMFYNISELVSERV